MDFASELPAWQVLLLAAISFLVGILGGFVGLALGTMRLPALLLIGVTPATAAGTNILVSACSALVGSYKHLRERRVNWRLVGLMGVPAAIGSFVGGFGSSASVPEGALILVAGVFVSYQSVEFLARLPRLTSASQPAPSYPGGSSPGLFTPGRGAIEATIGAIVGLVGGAVGLILGSVRLPLIIRILKIDPRIAAGSNLVIGSLMGAFGFTGHGVHGEVDAQVLLAMGLTGMVGSYIGAQLTGRAGMGVLMRTMSAVLLVVGILLIRDGVTRL